MRTERNGKKNAWNEMERYEASSREKNAKVGVIISGGAGGGARSVGGRTTQAFFSLLE